MVAADSGRHRYQEKFDVELLYGGDVYLLIHFINLSLSLLRTEWFCHSGKISRWVIMSVRNYPHIPDERSIQRYHRLKGWMLNRLTTERI